MDWQEDEEEKSKEWRKNEWTKKNEDKRLEEEILSSNKSWKGRDQFPGSKMSIE